MHRILYWNNILQLVINSFNQGLLLQKNFVGWLDQAVLPLLIEGRD